MFNIYKKLIVTESSPLTTPVTSPNTTPIASPNTSPILSPMNAPQIQTQTQIMDNNFSLCNCCCSSRTNKNIMKNTIQDSSQCFIEELNNTVDHKYEFGHATHYVYNSNTPRMIFVFDTGTPP
jgi:hypothetical protein